MGPGTAAAAALAATVIGVGALVAQQSSTITSITVREGTSMAMAVSPDRTKVAIDLQGGLWVVPIGGGAATRITDEWGDSRQPSWSPDGRTIAFQSYRDGMWRIWTVGANGEGLKALTSGSFDDREPVWSPDGKAIAFSSDRSGNYDVWVLDVASAQVRQITRDAANDFFPAWSPDGRQLAFVSTRTPAPGVYAIALDGSSETIMAKAEGTVGAPSWSPDGQVLFTAIQDQTSRLMLGDREIATGEDYFPFHAQWVSSDEFLYPADGRIKRRSLSRGELPPVEFTATLTITRPQYTRKQRNYDSVKPNRALGIVRPVLSPDGATLAFAALGDVWTMRLGSAPKQFTDDRFVDTDAAFSPDGTRVAFSTDRSGGMDIWIRDLATGRDRQLTSLPNADMAAAWSPDGRSIAFISNSSYEQGELYVIPAAGGTPRKLNERVFGSGYPSWTADGKFLITSM